MALGGITGVIVKVVPDTSATAKATFTKNVNEFVKTIKITETPKIVIGLNIAETRKQFAADLKSIFASLNYTDLSKSASKNMVMDNIFPKNKEMQDKVNQYKKIYQSYWDIQQAANQGNNINTIKGISSIGDFSVFDKFKEKANASSLAVKDFYNNTVKAFPEIKQQLDDAQASIMGKDFALKAPDTAEFAKFQEKLVALNYQTAKLSGLEEGTVEYSKTASSIETLKNGIFNFTTQYKLSEEQLVAANSAIEASNASISNSYAAQSTKITQSNAKTVAQWESLGGRLDQLNTGLDKWFKNNNKVQNNKELYTRFVELKNKSIELSDAYRNGAISAEQLDAETKRLNKDFNVFKNEASAAGAVGKTFTSKISEMATKFGSWTIITRGITSAIRVAKEMYRSVADLDAAMTELKKVTDETAATYKNFVSVAAQQAREVGTTMTDVVNTTADFARLGYALEDATQLSKVATIYYNVGDGLESIDEASGSIISTMQGFGKEADEAMSIVDKFNAIGNAYAISSGGVGQALQRSAAALAAAGNSIDESVALAAGMNTVIQDPEKVGTTLKTVSMFLRASKTEAEEAGIETEGMADSVSKLRGELMALSGVDIMLDENTYKSTYQIFKELSEIWGSLTDVTQANITEKLGGKRNANAVSALLNDFSIAEKALVTATNSAGSAVKENEKYLDSIAGKTALFKSEFQVLAQNIINSGLVKFVIGALTDILRLLNALLDHPVLTGVAAVGILGVIGKFNGLGEKATGIVTKLLAAVYNVNLSGLSAGLQEVFTSAELATMGIGGIGLAIGAVIGVISLYGKHLDNIAQKHDKLLSESEEAYSKVAELQEEYNANNEKISELRLASGDVDTNAITGLEHQNSLIEEQIKLYKQVADEKERAAKDALTKSIGATRFNKSGEVTSGLGSATGKDFMEASSNAIGIINGTIVGTNENKNTAIGGVGIVDVNAINEAKETLGNLATYAIEQLGYMGEYSDSWTQQQKDQWSQMINTIYQYKIAVGDTGDALNYLLSQAGIGSNDIISAGSVDAIKDILNNSEALSPILKATGVNVDELAESLYNSAQNGDLAAASMDVVNDSATEAAEAAKELSDALDELQSKYKTAQSAQQDLNENGFITIDTLQDMINKYPELTDAVYKYMMGELSAQDVLSRYNSLYDQDLAAYAERINNKSVLESAYLSWLKNLSNSEIKMFADKYNIDLKNCETLEKFKLAIKEKYLSEYGTKYDNFSKEMLQKELQALRIQQNLYRPRGGRFAVAEEKAKYESLGREIEAVRSALSAYDGYYSSIGSFVSGKVGNFISSDYVSTSSSKSSSSSTKNEAFNNDYNNLKHQLEMDYISEKEYYNKLEQLYKKHFTKGSEEWNKYEEEVYKGRKNLMEGAAKDIETLLDKVSDMLKQQKEDEIDALEAQKKEYEKLAEARKKALKDLQDEAEYTKEVAKRRKEVADLENRLASAKLDTSAKGQKNQLELEEELAKARENLTEYEYDHSIEVQEAQIDAELENQQAKVDAQIQILQDYLDNQNAIVNDSWNTINGMSDSLYAKLIEWNKQYGTGIESDITNAWKAAGEALDEYGKRSKALQTYNSLQEAISNKTPLSTSTSSSSTTKSSSTSTSSSKSSSSTSTSSSSSTKSSLTAGKNARASSSAKIYTASKGGTAKNQYFASDPVYTLLRQENGRWLVRWHGVSSGQTGWFNAGDLTALAKGKKKIGNSGLYITQEAGTEAIMHNGGLITPLAKGDSVFNNAATQRLWELANSPDNNWLVAGIAKSVDGIISNGHISNINGVNSGVNASFVFGDMIINGNADEAVLNKFRKDLVNDVTRELNSIYFKKGYTSNPKNSY